MRGIVEIPNWEYIEDHKDARRLLEKIGGISAIAVDTETTGLVRWKDRVLYWSMSDGKSRWCIPVSLLSEFKAFLQDPDRILIFHNANYDTWMLRNSGVDVMEKTPRTVHRRHCTMTAHALFKDNAPSHGLKFAGSDLICRYHDLPVFEMPSFMDTFEEEFTHLKAEARRNKESTKKADLLAPAMLMAPIHKIADYASFDAWVTYRLWEELKERLKKQVTSSKFGQLMGLRPGRHSLWNYFLKLEVPMLDVCYEMETTGIVIDQEYLLSLRGPLEQEMKQCQRKLNQLAGSVINPDSPLQLRKLFFDPEGRFQLKATKMTKGGASGKVSPSTDVEVLKKLSEKEGEAAEAAGQILEYRKKKKLLSTYIDGILDRITPSDQRIRCTFTQHVAATGRLSAVDPNLMNIPSRTADGMRIRQSFIPQPDYELLVVDQSTLEPRITAGLSRDKNMCTAMLQGRDFHSHTTHLMWGLDYEDVYLGTKKDEAKITFDGLPEHIRALELELAAEEGREARNVIELMHEYRNTSKTMGLGLTYGEGARKLGMQLKIKPQVALKFYAEASHRAPWNFKADDTAWRLFQQDPEAFYAGISEAQQRKLLDNATTTLAQSYVDKYWESYPGVREFFDNCVAFAQETGYSTTLLGRRRHLPELEASEKFLRFAAQRQAQNHPIQGTAAEIMKAIQIKWYEDPFLSGMGVFQQIQIHDEVVAEVHKSLAADEEFKQYIADLMANPFAEQPLPLGDGVHLPLKAGPLFVPNWKEGK